MSFPLINPKPTFTDLKGVPLVSGTIEFRDPSTDLPKSTYPTADDAEALTNANPDVMTLNARGEATSGIFLLDAQSYKMELKSRDSLGVFTSEWVVDDIQSGISGLGTGGAQFIGITDAGGNYNATDVEDAFTELASNTSGEGASIIGLEDSAGNYVATEAEAAFAEIWTELASTSVNKGASFIGLEDNFGWYDGTEVEAAFNEVGRRIEPKIKSGATIIVDTTLTTDTHLQFPFLTADRYFTLQMWLHGVQNGDDFKFTFSFTQTPQSGNIGWQAFDTAGTTVNDHGLGVLTNTFTITGLGSGLQHTILIDGYFATNATLGGNLNFQWAKATDASGDTQLNEGCWMRISEWPKVAVP